MGEVTFGGEKSQLYTGEVYWSPVVAQVTGRSSSTGGEIQILSPH